MKEIYLDGTYYLKNPTWDKEDSEWKAKQVLKILERNKIVPKKICEVGCGAGEILNHISLKLIGVSEYVGYDISPQAIELATAIKNDKLKFRNKDFLKEQNEIYDILLVMDVVEHVEDYINFLRELKGKAKYKIFHFPLDLSVLTVLNSSSLLDTRKKVGHIHYFTKDIVLEVLKDLEYEIIDYFYTDMSFVRPTDKLKIKLLLQLRKTGFRINKDITVKILGGYSLLILAK
ncbi:MAG: methyltransferase domain-containing protein [Ignavibacteriaceae bacterium]